MTERNPALWLQNRIDHTAEQERSHLTGLYSGREGVFSSGDLAVTQRGAGANMSVDVAAGRAMVLGDTSTAQGMYQAWNDAAKNVVISASDPTNPRRDIIVARIKDAFYAGATNAFSLEVITGTPAGSPADPTIPDSCLPLARVAVAAAASSITNANITDLRPRVAAAGGRYVCTSSARPATPTEGLEIMETDTDRILSYDGSNWIRTGWTAAAGRAEFRATATAASVSDATVTDLLWSSEQADTDGFGAGAATITIPAGLGGIYAVSLTVSFTATFTGTNSSIQIAASPYNAFMFRFNPAFGTGSGSICVPLAAADTVVCKVYQDSGSAKTITSTKVFLHRISA